jgi:hypothetical protein
LSSDVFSHCLATGGERVTAVAAVAAALHLVALAIEA